MEPKVGDRVSIDSKKVGQPRRAGVVTKVTKGLSGLRFQIRWDDGNESVMAPGAGVLTVDGRSSNSRSAGRGGKAAPKAASGKAKAGKARGAKSASSRRAGAAKKGSKGSGSSAKGRRR